MKWFKRKKNIKRDASTNQPKQRVISYYTASRRQLDSFERNSNAAKDDAVRQRRISSIQKYWFLGFIVVVLLMLLGYMGTLSTDPHITINGTLYRSMPDYQKTVSAAFGHDLRNRAKPLLMASNLQRKLYKDLPEAQTIIVKSSFLGHRPEVKITTASAAAIFSQPGSRSYVLSDRGRLLLPSIESVLPAAEYPVMQNQTGVSAKAGEQFLRPDEAIAFTKLAYQYKADGSKNVVFTLTKIPHELLAKEAGKGFSVKYLLSDDIFTQYGAMRATLKKLQAINQSPSEYMDVRLADKVYFK